MKKLLVIAALACVATPALANDMNKDHTEAKTDYYFNKIDADANGSISKSEHESFAASMFTEADTNKDGAISKEELKAEKMKEKAEMKKNLPAKNNAMMRKDDSSARTNSKM